MVSHPPAAPCAGLHVASVGSRRRERKRANGNDCAEMAQLHAVLRVVRVLLTEGRLNAEPEHAKEAGYDDTDDSDPAGGFDRFRALAPLAKMYQVGPDFDAIALVHAEGG